MSTPTQDERIEIWRYAYARSSLVEAREAAKLLIANPRLPDDIKRAIVYQVVISYARPFSKSQVTKSRRLIPLDPTVIPFQFKKLHEEYIQFRDQVFGHKDATIFQAGPLNKILVLVDKKGFELNTVSPFTMLETGLQQTIILCDALIQHCLSQVHKHAHYFIGIAEGVYVLSLEQNPAEWLEKKTYRR